MPASSKKQFRFLEALLHGGLKNPPTGLSKPKAQEFISATPSYKDLPETAASSNKYPKLKNAWSKKSY